MKVVVIMLLGLCMLILSATQSVAARTKVILPPTPPPKECVKTSADILFLLDDSGSVRPQKFEIVKKFVISVVRSLKIGLNQVRVAAMSYSTSAVINFDLKQYDTKDSLTKAIKMIKYRYGGTETHKALELVNTVLTKKHGDRQTVPDFVIVLTDGRSRRPELTIREAVNLQKKGVVMFSIGIGRRLRRRELEAMASKPTSEYTFNVTSFKALPTITKEVQTKLCEVIPPTIPPTLPANITNECVKTAADIVFLLDDSGSVRPQNFEIVKKFAIRVVSSLKIGPNQVRVAAMSYSTSAVINFDLKQYDTKGNLIKAIKMIKYRYGGTNTHKALRLVNTVLTKKHGDRPKVPDFVIVLTDGRSNNQQLTIREAVELQKKGVVMFSIGIGQKLRRRELEAMASKPTSQHSFNVSSFNALSTITKEVQTKLCAVIPPILPPTLPPTIPPTLPPNITNAVCKVADIVFLLDDSGSVGIEEFQKIKNFAIKFISHMDIGQNKVRVAVISFSTYAVINIYLNQYDDKKNLIRAINDIKYRSGGTNTHEALKLAHTVFLKQLGDRETVPNLAIVITDGQSLNPAKTKKEADRLKKGGVVMFSIGIGNKPRQSDLNAMASKPIAEHTFHGANYSGLKKLENKACKDPCEGRPCHNGGTCKAGIQGYKCLCAQGFAGKHCGKVECPQKDQFSCRYISNTKRWCKIQSVKDKCPHLCGLCEKPGVK